MNIKVYFTPTCTWCAQLKTWLKRKRVPFEAIDIIESDTARDEVIHKSGQLSVPVTEIDGEIIVGFDEAALEKAIAKGKGKN